MNAATTISSSIATARFPFHTFLRCYPFTQLNSSYPLFHVSSLSVSSSSLSVSQIQTLTTISDRVSHSSSMTEPANTNKQKPWLLVGLGNPGMQYQGTRHNIGFEMVDAFAESERISMGRISFRALFGKGFIGESAFFLAKPQTFMNLSGESVGDIVSYYKIPLSQVLVVHDDMDLPFAKLRLLPKGGHGGHNGMRSIITRFKGIRDFPRLKIGIGRPPGKMDPIAFVLQKFSKYERNELEVSFETGLEALRVLVVDGFNKSATLVNTSKQQVD